VTWRKAVRAGATGRIKVVAAVANHRRMAAGTAAAVCLAGGTAGWLLASGPGAAPAAGEAHAAALVLPGGGVTEVARLRIPAPRYVRPGAQAEGTVPADWYGYPSILPVISATPGWLHVRLAQRPDGSTAWIPAADATLSATPYRIVVNLADTRLALYDHGREVFSAPAGVGTTSDPTPPGQYFVAFTEPPPEPNPGYGPFILVTSDHSQAIGDWEDSGDAVIGIHGPLGESLAIGNTGARLSHGCIRLQIADQLKLSGMPPGTPITITG
jgi:lipoprotein-anchoring transpeptidase ErfK/SrfK